MSEPLTAAGASLVEDVHGTTMALTVFPARIRAIEAEAAARAVDEALSVERVREVLHRGGWGVPAGGCIQHSFTTARDGVTCVREDTTADTCEHASVHSTFAAALVAHLRGSRPEGEG